MMPRTIPWWVIPLSLVALMCATAFILPPRVSSDSSSYLEAMGVLISGDAPPAFLPNRILTTYAGLQIVLTLAFFTGSVLSAWYLLNAVFYVAGMWIFYAFLRRFFHAVPTALFGTLLLATNYIVISFGLNYLMDMGGWFFYLAALYFSYRYLESGALHLLLWAAFLSGFGGLFKEYAFLGFIPLLAALVIRERHAPAPLFRRFGGALVFAAFPAGLFYWFVYSAYGYTYADWFSSNQSSYGSSYGSRIFEYVKVFGSLFTFAWFLVVPGLYYLSREGRQLLGVERAGFLLGVFLSALPVFGWPAITQRIFFVPVVFCVLAACTFVDRKRISARWYLPLAVLYVLVNFSMDRYVLPLVNLDVVLGFR